MTTSLPRRYALVVAGILAAAAAGTATAFFPTNGRTLGGIEGHSHEKITTDALEALDDELFSASTPTASMRAANDAIVDGNEHVDDDQTHSALHFDGENFVVGQARILGLKEAVIASAQQSDAQGAREELGQALHSIQDFYAHSNWTNNHGDVNADLGVDGHQLQNTLGINDPAEVNGTLTSLLTSGYYHGEDRSPPTSITNGHKDRHGGPFDTLSPIDFGLGLNRDSNDFAFSPQFGQHETAAALAGEASKKYIREITDQLTQQQVALLLGKGPTLGIVIDTTNSMGSIIAAVRAAATQLVDGSIGTANEPSQYVLGQINDPVTPPPTVTANVDDFKTAIAALTTSPPGVDCPELAMAGMLSALGPMDPGGDLFVYTDASAKDSAQSGSVSALAQSKNIRVTFELFGSCSPIDPGYIRIANDTGGQVFFLTKQEVTQASTLPALLSATNPVTVLSVRDALDSGTKPYAVPVDATMTDVTFSLDAASLQIQRPNADVVQATDPDATILALTGGTAVKIHAPTPGVWTATVAASPAYRLVVTGSSTTDLARFRFVQTGGRDGHDGLFPIPGLPVAGADGTVDALVVGAIATPQFDLRRPNGEHIQDVALAAVPDGPAGELGGTTGLPSEPFLAYVTGTVAGGSTIQRVVPRVVQPQSVSIRPPLRQELHPGEDTTYVFTVVNGGGFANFDVTATDDKGFISSVTPSRVSVPAGETADFTVVLRPPANATPGTSEALTVRAASVADATLANFASLASVVAAAEATTTTTTPTTSTTSTTTLPCTTARCTIDAAVHGAACGDQVLPAAIAKKLERGVVLIEQAASASGKKAKHLLGHATHLLKAAGKGAGKAAKGKKPKLTAACATAIQGATGTVVSGLHP